MFHTPFAGFLLPNYGKFSNFMKFLVKLSLWGLASLLGLMLIGAVALVGTYWYIAPELPDVQALKEVQLQVPLRVYSHEGQLMAEYGEKRRIPTRIEDVPEPMVQAFLAAEDDRFYEHPGVDYQGVIRAGLNLILTGKKTQGASTITMQVAKNFFLSPEKTYRRKLREMFLAFKIEKELTKDEILELYLNKIYLGHRAYGVGAAAQAYYGATIDELDLPQIAMIAGLPKAPSGFNPIVNPERAFVRRNYVLGRMHALGFIDEKEYQKAIEAPLSADLHSPELQLSAPYVGELVRSAMFEEYGERAYTEGFRVYTTVRERLQRAADTSLRSGLLEYDVRHGYRGAIGSIDIKLQEDPLIWDGILKKKGKIADLTPALVTAVDKNTAQIYLGNGETSQIPWAGLAWAAPYINENRIGDKPEKAGDVVTAGDLVWVRKITVEIAKEENKKDQDPEQREIWSLSQQPEVAGALVSLRPADGAILAVSGGFDFYSSKFNRATQAQRQPGSSFKPFIYSAALEKEYTPASIINDAPVVFQDSALEDTWRPENYSGKFYGPTRMRVALTNSRNLVSIRLLRSIGLRYALNHAKLFGFDTSRLPADLSLALGSGTVTPLELARGYAVFANGGHLVSPYIIERIENADGEILKQEQAAVASEEPVFVTEAGEFLLDFQPADEQEEVSVQEPEQAVPDEINTEEIAPAEVVEPPKEPQVSPVAPRVLAADNAYQVSSMMRDVVRYGTGRKALKLGRKDLGGKTGTTNDQKDAWFSGYNADIVTTVWIGFDRLKPLGARETGANAALPMWVLFMEEALRDLPDHILEQPPGMVTVRIDPENGLLAGPDTASPIFETFRERFVPVETSFKSESPALETGGGAEMPEQLF
jgi:penicillin-binding protein 1A